MKKLFKRVFVLLTVLSISVVGLTACGKENGSGSGSGSQNVDNGANSN